MDIKTLLSRHLPVCAVLSLSACSPQPAPVAASTHPVSSKDKFAAEDRKNDEFAAAMVKQTQEYQNSSQSPGWQATRTNGTVILSRQLPIVSATSNGTSGGGVGRSAAPSDSEGQPDAAMLADAGAMAASEVSHGWDTAFANYKLSQDPKARNLKTKYAIAEDYWGRGTRNSSGDDSYVNNDFKFNDLQKARIWFDLFFSQLKIEHPEITYPYQMTSMSTPLEVSALYFMAQQANSLRNSLPTEQDRENKIAENTLKVKQAEEERAKHDAEIATAVKKPKRIGDTVCEKYSERIIGQVDQISGDRLKVIFQIHGNRSVIVNPFVLGSSVSVHEYGIGAQWYDSDKVFTCH